MGDVGTFGPVRVFIRVYGESEPEDRQAGPAGAGPAHDRRGLVSMNDRKHASWMFGVVAVGVALVLIGNAGGLLFLLWPLACMSMMVWMMWGMRGSASSPADHTHPDGVTHAHR